MITYAFTYETITPESAAEGDIEDHGFETEHVPLEPGSLRDVLRDARSKGIESNGSSVICRWWEPEFSVSDYGTGEQIRYALHINGVKDTSRKRINRLLAKMR
jgi:hypothetical protein